MSAFMVENHIINRVVDALAATRQPELVREIGCDLTTDWGKEAFGDALHALNRKALIARYGPEEEDSAYVYHAEPCALIQAYKSLRCLLYQCAEGEIPETSLLYANMDRFSGVMAHQIISELPAYDQAEW